MRHSQCHLGMEKHLKISELPRLCQLLPIFFILTSVLVSCSKSAREKNGETVPVNHKDSLGVRTVNKPTVVLDPDLLDGVWWWAGEELHALFYVSGDSLYYTEEQSSPYSIFLKDDTLVMKRDGQAFRFTVKKLTADSLCLYDDTSGEMTRLFKKGQ